MESRLVGFDARDLSAAAAALWDAERRSRFLLRLDVERPFSTDPSVWPSLFDTGQGIGLPAAERARLGFAGLRPPAWIGAGTGLWDDLEAMRRYLARAGSAPPPRYAVVAVSWLNGRPPSPVGPHLAPTTPAALSPAWTPLGFDVADGSGVSGLTNCGYRDDEVGALRSRWARALNDHHLFEDAGDALAFRDGADARVPEHAPFFVYALSLVETVGDRGPAA